MTDSKPLDNRTGVTVFHMMCFASGSVERAAMWPSPCHTPESMRPPSLLRTTAFAGVILGLSPDAYGQRLSIGVVGGGSLTDSFQTETIPTLFPDQNGPTGTRYFSPSKDYIA